MGISQIELEKIREVEDYALRKGGLDTYKREVWPDLEKRIMAWAKRPDELLRPTAIYSLWDAVERYLPIRMKQEVPGYLSSKVNDYILTKIHLYNRNDTYKKVVLQLELKKVSDLPWPAWNVSIEGEILLSDLDKVTSMIGLPMLQEIVELEIDRRIQAVKSLQEYVTSLERFTW